MIVLYKGRRGCGKTLTMVKDAFRFYKNGYRILANFKIEFGEYISPQEVLALNKESDLKDCVLVLDELQLFFDSRNFTRKENKDFGNFIQQIRKRNIHILGTTQYINTVELRFRQHTDILCYPFFDINTSLVKTYYFDITLLEDDMSGEPMIEPILVAYDARKIFNLYDSYEMLK